jgi:hypothetical protein
MLHHDEDAPSSLGLLDRPVVKRTTAFAAAAILIVFVVFIVNQTSDVVALATRMHPRFGDTVLWTLVLIYAAISGTVAVMMMRMRKRPPLPDPDDEAGVTRYRAYLEKRLARNRHIREAEIEVHADGGLAQALALLDGKAKAEMRDASRAVFICTAISQSGRLDGLMVLGSQARMIWRIARIYNQRPAVDEIVRLYGAVALTVFVAVQLEDMNIEEQLEPLAGAVLAGATGSIPGLNAVASIIAASVFEGGLNAFLTLRVGAATRRYCTATAILNRPSVRREAIREAASELGAVVADALPLAKYIGRAIIRRPRAWAEKQYTVFRDYYDSLKGKQPKDPAQE